jgi:hypothetical protein
MCAALLIPDRLWNETLELRCTVSAKARLATMILGNPLGKKALYKMSHWVMTVTNSSPPSKASPVFGITSPALGGS